MVRFLFTIVCLCFCCHLLTAQELSVSQKIKTVPGRYHSFSLDNLDNIYLLSVSNQLKKLNANGDSVSVFNEIKKFGAATLVDVSNPVKILLYYKGFATIVVLDGMLNRKNTIDLRKKGMFNVTAVGLSYDGKIWLYDDMENVLKKLNDEGEIIFQTADFRQIFDKALAPTKIYDQNQYVYLYDSLQGLFVFDYYGSFKTRIDITKWANISIGKDWILGTSNQVLNRYNINGFSFDKRNVPAALQPFKQLFFKEKKLYVLREEGLDIYEAAFNE
ncbi:hypothetical protein ABDK00_017420 [Niabella insulamsoli]|uniref:hypothetical protein n=1 Tax=Niabella insulamsoli TaxID=3144874 RepID=UPI0031FC0A41